jgi:organic hydroperoxide reductase OsmC/OhrA
MSDRNVDSNLSETHRRGTEANDMITLDDQALRCRNMNEHAYSAHIIWHGNSGDGTSSYNSYGRQYRVAISGKPDLEASADPMFRGEGEKHNPEDLFVASISACHMLTYLALCARKGVRVVAYEDEARGTMSLDGRGGGRFEKITLRPRVSVADAKDIAAAKALHRTAHEQCFIANSCSVPIENEPTVQVNP